MAATLCGSPMYMVSIACIHHGCITDLGKKNNDHNGLRIFGISVIPVVVCDIWLDIFHVKYAHCMSASNLPQQASFWFCVICFKLDGLLDVYGDLQDIRVWNADYPHYQPQSVDWTYFENYSIATSTHIQYQYFILFFNRTSNFEVLL